MQGRSQIPYLKSRTSKSRSKKSGSSDAEMPPSKKRKGFISSTNLVFLAFASAFFPRFLENLGAPSPINFLHFMVIPVAFGVVLLKSRSKNRQQLKTTQLLLFALLVLLVAELASALLNNAGVINVFLSFMLLGEPFILLIAIVSIPMPLESFERFQKWFRWSCLFHIGLALTQRYVLRYDLRQIGNLEPADTIQGIFFESGAGHVVGTSVALSFAAYYFVTAKNSPIWIRLGVAFAALMQMLAADAKQVLLSMLVGLGLLMLTKLKNIAEAVKYLVIGAIAIYALLWAMQNLEAFASFNVWVRPDLYGPDGEVTQLKTAAFRVIPTYYESSLNWFFGLGPGHTVGRLGGWMIQDYSSLLTPLGVTTSPASRAVWQAVADSYWGDKSSMFSPLFGWAGIWGDLGLVGLGTYFFLSFLIWQYICPDDLCKFLMMTVFVVGLIFSQMEEPGYMLTIATIIGLRWQEKQFEEKQRKQKAHEAFLEKLSLQQSLQQT
jgi:hypothetical protein